MLRFYDCIGFLASYKEKQMFSDLCVMFFQNRVIIKSLLSFCLSGLSFIFCGLLHLRHTIIG